jgi:recombination protein RecR
VYYARPLGRLVGELEKLPGVGPKTAQRLAFHILSVTSDEARLLAESILDVKANIHFCASCHNFTDQDVCEICRDPRRSPDVICVVAEPRDVIAMEKTNEFRGVYHVLQGVISPMDGITADDLTVRHLLQRIQEHRPTELILATNPTVEGETTAMYLSSVLKPLGVKVTRIAHGLPVGGDLDYADQATLIKALEWRREF